MKFAGVTAAFWSIVLVLLAAVPPFLSTGWQNTLINVLIAALFAVSFNLLTGFAGMLSFGHSAYYGVGAFAVLHAMRAIEAGAGWIPAALLPLIGGVAGLVFGLIFGAFATKKSGVYFSLVTLALAELLHALAPQVKGIFGSESGMGSIRPAFAGLSFATSIEVYYFTLVWVAASMWILWAYLRTPFGRLTLALRDSETRVSFLGYSVPTTKTVVFGISAAFSGISGGLMAFSNETVNYIVFSSQTSSLVVMHTFIGGSNVFLGPVIGAAVLTVFSFVLSDVTRSWLIYQGILFVAVMLFASEGLGGVVQLHARHAAELSWRQMVPLYLLATLGVVLVCAGSVFVVECLSIMVSEPYALARRSAGGFPAVQLAGMRLQPTSIATWLAPLVLFACGGALLARARKPIIEEWSRVRQGNTQETTPAENGRTPAQENRQRVSQ